MQPPSIGLNTQIDISALQAAWQAFDTLAHLGPIRSEADYEHMVTLMNALLEVAGDDEDHPLSGLLALAAELVSRYEQEHQAIEAANPQDALRFLMEARGLKQEDLSAIVSRSNLSAILAGKRMISATMAGKLGAFFGIGPTVFGPR
jgi:HTH-type transcriptional regulator / antitoxin HigA